MNKLIVVGLISLGAISCQSFHSAPKVEVTRSLASTPAFRVFLQELAQKSGRYTTTSIEEAAISYIRRTDPGKKYGNWNELGISEEQARAIKSLDDELPYMPKVRKWITENVTKFARVEVKVAEAAYDAMKAGMRTADNPYRLSTSANQQLTGARNRFKPQSLLSKQERIMVKVNDLSPAMQTRIKNNMTVYMKRAGQNPSLIHNGEEIIESGVTITRKTGQPGMGQGCKAFSESASVEVLAEKANVDVFRAQQVEELAYIKNGKAFGKFDEIPAAKRLTAQEVDEATEQAFMKVKGMTQDEASIAVRRLKREPCQVY